MTTVHPTGQANQDVRATAERAIGAGTLLRDLARGDCDPGSALPVAERLLKRAFLDVRRRLLALRREKRAA
jgi:hypothetical protein